MPSRPHRDAAATRAALIAAAADIFKADGYFATDSNAIARKAGYAPASFYNHFADKPEILIAVYQLYSDLEFAEIRAVPERPARSRFSEVLLAMMKHHGEWARFRTDLRTVANLEPRIDLLLKQARLRQLATLGTLTGLSAKRDLPSLVMIRSIVQHLSEALADGESAALPADAILGAAENAIQALMSRR